MAAPFAKAKAEAIKYPLSDEQPVMYAYKGILTADWKEVLVDVILDELKTH